MSVLRWAWLVLASLFLLAGVFVCSGGLGTDPHAYFIIHGAMLFCIGAIPLGVFLLIHGPSMPRIAWWVVLVVSVLPLLWFAVVGLVRRL